MKWTSLALLLALSPQSVPTTERSATIEGRILNLGTSEPIPGMPVQLVTASPDQKVLQTMELQNAMEDLAMSVAAGVDPEAIALRIADREKSLGLPAGTLFVPRVSSVLTDADGRFSFKSLSPGIYSLRVEQKGYFALRSNGDPWPVDGRRVTVEAGKLVEPIEFRMFQGGVVTGTVRDPDGKPIAGVNVLPSQIIYEDSARNPFENGREILSPLYEPSDTRTNDRGEYRMFWLPPGQYYIEAKSPLSFVDETLPGKNIWARTFSPSAMDPSAARLVTVRGGDEVTGVDITFRRDDTPSFKISGVVRNALPFPPPTGTGGAWFILVPREPGLLDPEFAPSFQKAIPSPKGEFEIRGVHPGNYDLYTDFIGELNPDVKVTRLSSVATVTEGSIKRHFTSRTPVEVRDRDLSGLMLTVDAGVDLDGEVVVRGGGTVIALSKLKVSLRTLGTMPRQFASIIAAPSVDAAGKFHAPNVPEGKFRLVLGGLPDGAYVEDIRQGGQSVYDDGCVLSSPSIPIQIVVNSGGNTIEGVVKDREQKPIARVTVVLVPAESMRRNPARYRTAYSDDSGKFNLQKVPPGIYTAFALRGASPSSWMNANVLAKYQDKGKIVNVVPNSRTQLELFVIPAF